jgi:hypothetical protein
MHFPTIPHFNPHILRALNTILDYPALDIVVSIIGLATAVTYFAAPCALFGTLKTESYSYNK